jgi:hypothetical protein
VFSIWGLIYLGLIAFAVYQALPAQRANPRLRRIGYLFALSCVANSAWIFVWHYELFPWSLVIMIAILITLIGIYLRLEIGRVQVSKAEKWFVHVPFSIYLAWITVATIANTTILLDYVNWSGWGISPETWTVVMLVAGLTIAAVVSIPRRDVAYLLVIVWAFAGIAVKHAATPVVAASAGVAAAVALALAAAMPILAQRALSFRPMRKVS